MLEGVTYWSGLALLAALLFGAAPAHAEENFGDLSISGYADLRIIAPPREVAWLNGGLSKFRYGNDEGHFRFAEAVVQGRYKVDDTLSAVLVLRGEPEQRIGIDMLEGYVSWHPASNGPFSWSAKTGAFFPTISLENDDLGWASPYTLTPSAINSWIGEELRTIGSEAILRYDTSDFGTVSLTGAVTCCNDPAGVLMAERGWAMDDRPAGIFSDQRLPDATLRLFRQTPPDRTPMFDEIDGRPGWYAGLTWQMAGVGKLSVLRYDNEGDPNKVSGEYAAWDTRFWSYGARTGWDELVVIAQGLQGQTVVGTRFGLSYTFFQSAFLLASHDLSGVGAEDWRASVRGDVFATRHPAATPSIMDEDGHAVTVALSWQHFDWLRVTGEMIAMQSRRREYLLDGFPSAALSQQQLQLSARFFF
ncbi:MAG: hypothetical protein ABI191_05205 [Rhizomicrobium sp.]